MLLLKQGASVTVKIGPGLDSTDASAETGLTISQADVRLSKNGGDMAQKNSTTACSHDESGFYNCYLNATDTATLGSLQLMVSKSGVLPVFHDYMVVTANYYDTVFGSDSFDVNLNPNQTGVNIGIVTTVNDKTGYYLAPDQSSAVIGTTTNLTNKTGFRLSSDGVSDVWNKALSGFTTAGSAGLTLSNLLRIGKNKWAYSGTTFTIYADNGTDALYQFTLDDADDPTVRTPV